MSASLPDEVLGFLRRHRLAAPDEVPPAEALPGGVSSDIWRVGLRGGAVCVKRALPRLRVAQLWEAPVARNGYERRWLEAANAIVPGIAPRVLAGDDGGCFAMEYLGDLPVWKEALRAGRCDPAFAGEVGRNLSILHGATARRPDMAAQFATDSAFRAIRLEPYLLATARLHPDLAFSLEKISGRTANTRLALVHGDVSPKNILVGPQGPIFLDAECAWYGDPAFDLAFCLNHLLLKCLWVPGRWQGYLECFASLSRMYFATVTWEEKNELEQRTASLLPGLLLARVDGKSPVEYLTTDADRNYVREKARQFLLAPPVSLAEISTAWRAS